MTIIEIRPFRNGWKCFEAPGVEPAFLNQEDAISYAKGRACFRNRNLIYRQSVCTTGCGENERCWRTSRRRKALRRKSGSEVGGVSGTRIGDSRGAAVSRIALRTINVPVPLVTGGDLVTRV